MSLSIDVTSLPSISSSIFKNESSSTTSTLSGKSIGRNEQYVSPDIDAFNKYMLSKSPEDIGPSDSASNDPLTSFSIRSNAVKTNADAGVSMDSSTQSRPSSNVGCDQMDFSLTKGINVSASLDSCVSISTNQKKEKSKKDKSRKHYPRIEADSDSEDYVLDDSDSDDGKCKNCKYKKKYFALRMRMKQVAMQLIEDL
ncbi:NSP5 [Rotavirus A human/Bethesda/DC23/1976/G3P[8]]|uniref:Non-structural protein 5 n=11 Tax=Rotavirus A human/Bethesda/G3P[8] TaxID=641312 RepID=D1GGR7_9REOV|nr:NSP5 [Rotavirus A human/Bethesda/DC2102/1976/G3P[8]]ACZ51696.1 NSP5 [Rotavirus A human/Bethesda/DC2266/1976/G3P[8]]ACZ51816.1 NSP5 [Rotavirus A human/Bethesda/DC23/1976/G3P[8]]ACZ51828.1 NSP5 [Rotavirus A human/Bethesda/DC139/1976/G3P[8]]ACZ51840.1 NSP5 [Rotavirus A human/Bethesda/DC129/1976/G3P[8]]ACZ51876.1 NSP5 [Rotavirus A human/Bethesda/DC133/1976/G3P[8]]ACZ51900.1 NSP5 [Rotavirus A human/Bethesda/DC1496/1976/G3P[8]]ACZ51971.1 NSP5 [Rotavirus A human/Bethesda/DC1505/1976/G3P[8]]ACZ5